MGKEMHGGDLETSVQRLLFDVFGRLEAIRAYRRATALRFAYDFNIFSVLEPREIHLSRVLACLLDPSADHGQGATFLKSFVSLINKKASDGQQKLCEDDVVDQIFVGKEWIIPRVRRRPDIVVFRSGKPWICIENKPWAADQHSQLEDYVRFMREHNTQEQKWVVVYLVGDEGRVSPFDDSNLVRVTYGDLREWLEQCVCLCKASRVREAIEQLNDYISREFVRDAEDEMAGNLPVVEAIIKDPGLIEAAWAVIDARDECRRRLIRAFEGGLRARLDGCRVIADDADGSFAKKKREPGSAGYGYLIKTPGGNWIRLAWERGEFKDAFVAVCGNKTLTDFGLDQAWVDEEGARNLARKLYERLEGSVSDPFGAWLWWKWMPEGFRDWTWSNLRPWTGILEGGEDGTVAVVAREIEAVVQEWDEIAGPR